MAEPLLKSASWITVGAEATSNSSNDIVAGGAVPGPGGPRWVSLLRFKELVMERATRPPPVQCLRALPIALG